jgi:mercuric ion transport protein
LILGGISGAGMMTAVERFRPILMAVTFVFLGGAFYLSYRPRRSTPGGDKSHGATPVGARSTMMTLNRIMLWAVTAMVVVFLFFPQAFTGLLASNSEFTADMDRTVVAIEGMT